MQALKPKNLLNCRGRLLSLEQPVAMGILNVTPDSFFGGSRVSSTDDALQRVEKMLNEGAAIIDIGAQSTRPGAEMISEEEELQRAMPVLQSIVKAFPEALISIDTFQARVADEAMQAGASIINDISAGDDDEKMFAVLLKHKPPYIMMHKRGRPADMQRSPAYADVVNDILSYFIPRIAKLSSAGLHDVVIDPGFGFGKTLRNNYDLLNRLDGFRILELPLLVGISRKSMVQKVTGSDAAGALNGTTVLNTIALMKGASILRVHDAKEAVECIKLYKELLAG